MGEGLSEVVTSKAPCHWIKIRRARGKGLSQVTHEVVLNVVGDHVYGGRDDIDKEWLFLPLRLRDSRYTLRDEELKIRRLR